MTTSPFPSFPAASFPEGLLFVLSGPAGSGKTTLCERMLQQFSEIQRAVTATTRSPRPGEADGEDYYFLTPEDFEKKKKNSEFLEWATVHGRSYGTLRKEVSGKMNAGKDVLLNIDVQGMLQIKDAQRKIEEGIEHRLVTVFIQPPSLDELIRRMKSRNSDNAEEITRRIETAKREMEEAHHFDYILLSGSRDEDFDRIRSIYIAEKMRVR